MRVARLDFVDPSFPASLAEVPEPDLPGPGWARLAVTGGGVSGGGRHFFQPTAASNLVLMPYLGLPMELGHEIVGTVLEAGPDCPFPVGARVAVDAVIACEARGIEPRCDRCRAGAVSQCRNLSSRIVSPGYAIGLTSGLGSGWADQVVAHASMLHTVPDAVPVRGETLYEPLSIAVHALLHHPPAEGPVLVWGGGIIGLCTVAALRVLFPALDVVAVAKHAHQQAAAAALGARAVVAPEADGSHFAALAELSETAVTGGGDLSMLAGGFRYVCEAVGSAQAVTHALRSTDSRGTLLLMGLAGLAEVDLTPLWFKEQTVVGASFHGHDAVPAPAGGSGAGSGDSDAPVRHSVDVALEILAAGGLPADLVTHEVRLDDFRDGIATALDRASGAIKVVFRP